MKTRRPERSFLILIAIIGMAFPAFSQDTDWGDAPDIAGVPGYATLAANNGANHGIMAGFCMGTIVDAEPDGQPDPAATGDDLAGTSNDEDGVTFLTAISAGQNASVSVSVTAPGSAFLDAWIDFNQNGNWMDPGEQIATNLPVVPGPNIVSFAVPATAGAGQSFARFRLSTVGNLTPDGFAPDGEVEDYVLTLGEEDLLDWGDAPDSVQSPGYPTLSVNNGANHVLGGSLYLGAAVDAETDGQPTPLADGDDTTGTPDDEDGISFTSPLIPGALASVTVTASAPGLLDAWIDFNGNQSWADAGEQIFSSQALTAGSNLLSFTVPAQASTGGTFSRFRVSTAGGLSPAGQAADGEVEDEMVSITEETLLDWGDAPDSTGTPGYPTLSANSGANHGIGTVVYLGASVDAESDGQPDATATGDDNDGNNDDDGVSFTSNLIPNQTATVDVTAAGSGAALLDAWVDFNGNKSWADAGEQIFSSKPLNSGVNHLSFNVPTGASSGTTVARFRASSSGGLSPTGHSVDGEVEDYQVTIQEEQLLDFGDAPDAAGSPGFPTLLVHNGARHIPDGVTYLGGPPDVEPDGQPDGTATGDDLAGVPDDEDGVAFNVPLIPGFTAPVDVLASVPGFLDAWIDFNGNGSWTDSGEQVAVSLPLNPGPNQVMVQVPASAAAGGMMARFRFSTVGGLSTTGQAPDGEVEDYEVTIEEPGYDYGDAPDPTYPTLSASSGAVHQLVENIFLGTYEDAEADGQPDATATGDDLNGQDDDDGVKHSPNALIPGTTMNLTVTASSVGYFSAWVDFNGDGDWTDSGEKVITDQSLSAGANSLSYAVPAGAVVPTFARYRFSSVTGLTDISSAPDGEVEDYYLQAPGIFSDGFQSGDMSAWSSHNP